jgi:type IV pilus assembly protein PilP
MMKRLAETIVIAAVLGGCTAAGETELRQWMAETQKQTVPSVKPLAEPKQFVPFQYAGQAQMDPFNVQKVAVAISRAAAKSNSGLKPDLDRRREPLEAFPLDTITMVGGMKRGNTNYALIRVENVLYQVRPGNYLGQNFGQITKITETEVTIKELVQDAVGDWVERISTLQLQESKNEGKK